MPQSYRHEAQPYQGRDAFITSCATVVREGLDNDERPIVLAAADKLGAVRGLLGSSADDVTFVPTDEHGRNPARIATMLDSFQAAGDGRHSLGVNETVVGGRSRSATIEAQLSDFVLNDPALQIWPLSIVCLYDVESIDEDSLQAMQRSHAVIRGHDANPDYLPDLAATMYAAALDPSPGEAIRLEVNHPELSMMRAFVRSTATMMGILEERIDDLVLAANEIVTNSLRYGGGKANLAMWFADGAAVCEVIDAGFIASPLAGRLAPAPSATSGRGLWLANHLCDLVQRRSSQAGTVIRLHVDR